jgi:hypothetical protein
VNERTQVIHVESTSPERLVEKIEHEIARDDRIIDSVHYAHGGAYGPYTALIIFNPTNPGGRKA